MKNIYILLSLIFIGSTSFAQNYELGLLHNGGYNFSIIAVPDFDSAGNTDISDIGFTLMLPAGADDVTGQISALAGRIWNVSEFDAAFLTGEGLGDGTLDAFQFNMPAGQSLVAHTTGQMIDLVSFDVSNMPMTGVMSFLLNNDPIAMGAGGVLDSFYNSNIDATTTQDYFSGIAPGLDSFNFDTLSVEQFEELNAQVKIFPNPTSDYINISSNTVVNKIEMFDLSGKSVLISFEADSVSVNLLHSGVYLLKIHSGEKSVIKKVIIQ